MSWQTRGWQVFAAEPATLEWVEAVRDAALACAADADLKAAWLRHGSTWFVGVDVLANDGRGAVAGGQPLTGAAFEAAVAASGVAELHAAQISVTYPGYPRQDPGESDAAHRFRKVRDAAHLDGLLPEGPEKRRHLREPHAYILGICLTQADAQAAPLVVWEGSQTIIAKAFREAFQGHPPEAWADIDVTEIYQHARKQVFEACKRVELPLQVGEAVLLHRQVIHGVAPWADGAQADLEGRAIAYFRPCFETVAEWI